MLTALAAGPLLSCETGPQSGPTTRPTPTYALGSIAAPTPSHSPTATASPAPAVTSVSLQGFTNGPWLEQQDPVLASSIKTLGWMQDGIDSLEASALQDLLYIAVASRSVASSVVSLSWVQDGVDELEAEAIDWINNFGGPQVALSLVSLGWMQDGVGEMEVKAIEEISYIDYRSTEVASSVVALEWIQDDISHVEAKAIEWLANIGSAEVASSVVSLDWVRDGVGEVEVKAVEEISYIDSRSPGVAMTLVSLGWVQDGVDDLEVDALSWVGNIGSAEVASSVVSLGWMQDGIDEIEAKAIEQISYIAYRDSEAALRIVGMPFLETIEPPDEAAMAALREIAADYPNAFVRIMSHPALVGGISNNLASVVATMNGVARKNPDLIDVLLDPSRVHVEQRTVTLPLSGDVTLSIIRTRTGASRSMDLLEHSVRSVEDYMGLPLPTKYVGLLYENSVSGSNAGTNFGTHIAILPAYDIDDGSHEAQSSGSTIAHEVAHYYWSGNEDWVDEGAADFMASIVEGARTGQPIDVTNPPCGYAGTIAELESLGIAQDDIEFGCNYSLGERLFLNLYRTLGEERFRPGFRELYLASEIEDNTDDLRGTSVGIEHAREAFRSDDGAESAAIARWYDGTEPFDLYLLDTGPVDPSLTSINGRIDEAYVTASDDGPPVSSFDAKSVSDWVILVLEYSYDVSGGPNAIPLEIVEYYEDGFEFRRRTSSLTAEAQYIGGTRLFSIGSPPSRNWAPGRYIVYVYSGERKIAEVVYDITP